MTTHLTYLLLGLGLGAVIASLALGVVVTHRASNVINFAHGAIGTYLAFVYYELRASGDLLQPIIGLPGMSTPASASFSPARHSPPWPTISPSS